MFTGIGMMIGPLAGGLLYEFGGYITPFIALGALLLILGISCFFIDASDLTVCSENSELPDI